MERKDGYYWVKYDGHWTIGRFRFERWELVGYADKFDSEDFDSISSSPITEPNT
jgi:hypothetical protein